jgi:hypothetical protein
MSICKAFNNILINFIEDCISVFPEEPDFKIYKTGALLLKQYNPKKMPSVFKIYSKSYKTQIINKDETFFLNKEFSEVNNLQNEEEIVQLIGKIRKYWNTLSNKNKTTIWEYLNILLKLVENI